MFAINVKQIIPIVKTRLVEPLENDEYLDALQKERKGANRFRFKKIMEEGVCRRTRTRQTKEEESAEPQEGEHPDGSDELEREMEVEFNIDTKIGKEGVDIRTTTKRRPHLKMVRQRHKMEGEVGA